MTEAIQVPRYFEPRPHQQRAWNILEHGDEEHDRPDFFFLLWSRRAGKDTFSHQKVLYTGFCEPGNQHVYVGVDNVWIRDNIFNMYIEGRTFWSEYPEDIIEPKDTKREVWFRNNPPGIAPTRIKYVGLQNEKGVVGSGYRDWMISDTGLFPNGAFDYLFPIWQDKKAQGLKFQVGFNGTPRGMNQDLYKLLRQYTGEDDPLKFPGWHETPFGTCYVDHVTIEDVQVPIRDKDGVATGAYKPLYTEKEIEDLRQACIKSMGNDKWFRQEFYCDFLAVNAGLVYQGWEIVKAENRYTTVNRDPNHPVFLTFDLGSKGKFTDATAAIYWQSFAGITKILDTYESRGKAFVECLADMTANPLFRHVTFASLPWDVERGYTEKSALDEARERYKTITFEALKQTPAVRQDIEYAQLLMPNLWVSDSAGEMSIGEQDSNHSGGAWFAECIEQYQYRRINKMDDWGKPVHDWSSHCLSENTMIETIEGPIKIKEAPEYGYVFTDDGFKPYWNCGIRKIDSDWLEIETESGDVIKCTLDHIFPTKEGLKKAENLTTTDTLRYNNIANNPKENNETACRHDNVEWNNLVSLSRREVLSKKRATPPPSCIQKILRGNTQRPLCSSCKRRCDRQHSEKFEIDDIIRTSKIPYDSTRKKQKTKRNGKKVIQEIRSTAQRMGENRRRTGLVQGALEQNYWEINDSRRERVRSLSLDLYDDKKGKTSQPILFEQLQNESANTKIKRISRRRETKKAWCLEVENQFFYANNILTKNCMDTFRYVAMTIKAAESGKFSLGAFKQTKTKYASVFDEPKPEHNRSPIYMTDAERKDYYDRQSKQQRGFGSVDDARGSRWSF